MSLVPPSLQAFLESEAALRAQHGQLSLYVRPQPAESPYAPRGVAVVGGWAFLDGDPAILPEGLDVLVLTFEGPGGMATYPRAPDAVFAILAPYLSRATYPCPHLVARVPERDRPALAQRLAALPDAMLGALAPRAARTFYPILKPADWSHAGLVVHTRLLPRADAPIVAFAEDLPSGYAFLTRQESPDADPDALLASAITNLEARTFEVARLAPSLLMSGGADLTAERLLDRRFARLVHEHLGPSVWIAVPHRVAIYALGAQATPAEVVQFTSLARFESTNGPSKGHAPVSPCAFLLREGCVVDMAPLEQVGAPPAARPSAPHPRDLVLVDAARQEIHASVVIVGTGAKDFGRALHAASGGPSASASAPHDVDAFVMRLGDIRGWATYLHVYALEASLDAIATADELVRSADAVVLVQASPGPRIEPALYALASAAMDARRSASPCAARTLAFVGPPEAQGDLATAARITPEITASPGERPPMKILIEIFSRLLASLRA
jgi:hypothetical protein